MKELLNKKTTINANEIQGLDTIQFLYKKNITINRLFMIADLVMSYILIKTIIINISLS